MEIGHFQEMRAKARRRGAYAHAVSRVLDLQQFEPAIFHRDRDAVCARVERVLEELLDSIVRALHNLARRNAVHHGRIEPCYVWHAHEAP